MKNLAECMKPLVTPCVMELLGPMNAERSTACRVEACNTHRKRYRRGRRRNRELRRRAPHSDREVSRSPRTGDACVKSSRGGSRSRSWRCGPTPMGRMPRNPPEHVGRGCVRVGPRRQDFEREPQRGDVVMGRSRVVCHQHRSRRIYGRPEHRERFGGRCPGSSVAIGVVGRRRLCRLHHVHAQELWLQQEVREGRLRLVKTPGPENVADILTSRMGRDVREKHMRAMGFE